MTDVLDRLTAALAGGYAVQRELGSGGMATVYLAEDLKHKRKVAVKVLRPELAAVLGFLAIYCLPYRTTRTASQPWMGVPPVVAPSTQASVSPDERPVSCVR